MSAGDAVRWNHRDVPQPVERRDCWRLEAKLPPEIITPLHMRRVRVSWDGASYSLHLVSGSGWETMHTLTSLSAVYAPAIPARVTNDAGARPDRQQELELKKWCLEKALNNFTAYGSNYVFDAAEAMFDWFTNDGQPTAGDAS